MVATETFVWRWLRHFREVNRDGKNFTATQMGILLSLATHADGATGRDIFPSVATVARNTGAKKETVRAALATAAEQRVIAKVRDATPEAPAHWRLVAPDEWSLWSARPF